jgi:hypothetical protein
LDSTRPGGIEGDCRCVGGGGGIGVR